MKLPITTDILGAEINIKEEPFSDGEKVGEWHEGRGIVTIKSNEPEFGKHITLVHEFIHIAETMALQNGLINERIDHDFIYLISYVISALLVECGALVGLTRKDVEDFQRLQQESFVG